ncbi:CAP domain-containing protein [Streptomyces sp. NPDC057325]|uniref:CAP domain-containing protein n=1 Tax=unclassified Streptomyces TaxID=2593676 RepID=UPI0036303ED9
MRYHVRPRPSDRSARADGRHRGRGGARRRPGLRTVVAVAGAAAVALTVATGTYLASTAPGGPAAAASPAPASTPAAVPVPVRTGPEAGPGQARAQLRERLPLLVPGGGAAGTGRAERYAGEVVALVNAERAEAGCRSLHSERRLRAAAQGHADDMAARAYYAHSSPEGRDGGDRMRSAGYAWSTWAENIHRGPATPARTVAEWMESPGHRANILNCAFKDIGVGVSLGADGPWWVQNFGARR